MADQNYDEINKLLYEYKAGNNEALFALYEFYKPLFISSVKRIIQKEFRLLSHKQDILSDCIFILKKLIDQYDPSLSYFSYFLSTRVDINLFRYAIDKYFPKEEILQDDHFPEESQDPFNKIDNVICIHQAMGNLPEKSKEVIQVYFFDGLDQKECAQALGITQGAFSKRLSKALEQMKLMLGEDFLFD
jgi:RNA polymerase sigma-70 factor (ECF subfamily)